MHHNRYVPDTHIDPRMRKTLRILYACAHFVRNFASEVRCRLICLSVSENCEFESGAASLRQYADNLFGVCAYVSARGEIAINQLLEQSELRIGCVYGCACLPKR